MNNQIHAYDPLTSENAALVLVDHQVGLMTGVRDYSTGELKHNVVALARAAKALKLPIIVTTTARDSMWGPTFPELVEALPGVEIIDHRDGEGGRVPPCLVTICYRTCCWWRGGASSIMVGSFQIH